MFHVQQGTENTIFLLPALSLPYGLNPIRTGGGGGGGGGGGVFHQVRGFLPITFEVIKVHN